MTIGWSAFWGGFAGSIAFWAVALIWQMVECRRNSRRWSRDAKAGLHDD